MANTNNNNKDQNGYTPEIMKGFIEVQKKKMDNESKELTIKEREITSNERIALKTLEVQAGLLKDQPKGMRKNLTRLAWVIGLLFIVICIFLGWLLYSGNERFATMVIEKGTYLVVALVSYYVGRKNGRAQQARTQEADIEQLD